MPTAARLTAWLTVWLLVAITPTHAVLASAGNKALIGPLPLSSPCRNHVR